MQPFVRAFATAEPDRSADLAGLYDVCVRTADLGADARGMYASDLLMGDLFAVPYAVLEPQHTFVLDDGAGTAVGYVVATADTARYAQRYRDEWITVVADRYRPPANPPVTPDDAMLILHYEPERMIVPALADYPAHLHINLLPDWQRQGWGRELVRQCLAALHAAGAPAIHLGMVTANVNARPFYDRLGFTELSVPDPGPLTYLGRDTVL